MTIRSIIIDDDPFAVNQLSDALALIQSSVEIVAIATNGTEGIELIQKHKPELIFLDVEMPDMSGFEMLSNISDISFKTIFTTSFKHYAIRAIRFNALDYLLKPIDIDELRAALRRFNKSSFQQENIENIKGALNNFTKNNIASQQIVLHQHDGIINPKLDDILYVEGQSNYSMLRLVEKKNILVSKTLAYFENRLLDCGFYRCHKSYLIHGQHIKSFTKSSSIIMTDDTEVPISRRKKKDMMSWYGAYQSASS